MPVLGTPPGRTTDRRTKTDENKPPSCKSLPGKYFQGGREDRRTVNNFPSVSPLFSNTSKTDEDGPLRGGVWAVRLAARTPTHPRLGRAGSVRQRPDPHAAEPVRSILPRAIQTFPQSRDGSNVVVVLKPSLDDVHWAAHADDVHLDAGVIHRAGMHYVEALRAFLAISSNVGAQVYLEDVVFRGDATTLKRLARIHGEVLVVARALGLHIQIIPPVGVPL